MLVFRVGFLRAIPFFTAFFAAVLLLILSLSAHSATIEYEYDDLGRLIAVVLSNGDRIDLTFDDAGNRITRDIDNTGGGFPIEFIVESGVQYEGNQIVFNVRRLGNTSGSQSVDYNTFDDTATGGSDYTSVSNTLTFLSGQAVKTVSVSTTSDADAEEVERFFFDLSNPTNGTVVSVSRAYGYIIDEAEPNYPPIARIYNVYLPYPGNQDVCVTCNADPDGDEATVKSVSAPPGITATITTDNKKINVSGNFQGVQDSVNYTIEDPNGGQDSSVINVYVEESGGQ